MSTPAGLTIQRLGDANFKTWQVDMRNILMREGLWRVTQSEKGAPGAGASDADIERYEEKKERASATIQLWMEEDLRGRYGDDKYCSDPATLWAQLTADRKEVIVLDKNYLRKQLFEVSLESSGSVADYLIGIDAIIDKLRTCDVTIINGEKWFTIINGLPATWSVFISSPRGNPEGDHDTLHSAIKWHERTSQSDNHRNGKSNDVRRISTKAFLGGGSIGCRLYSKPDPNTCDS